jgi:hypothetical protein
MSIEEWGVLVPDTGMKPWPFEHKEQALQALRTMEGALMVKSDGTEFVATDLRLVRRTISDWEEVDHESQQMDHHSEPG